MPGIQILAGNGQTQQKNTYYNNRKMSSSVK